MLCLLHRLMHRTYSHTSTLTQTHPHSFAPPHRPPPSPAGCHGLCHSAGQSCRWSTRSLRHPRCWRLLFLAAPGPSGRGTQGIPRHGRHRQCKAAFGLHCSPGARGPSLLSAGPQGPGPVPGNAEPPQPLARYSAVVPSGCHVHGPGSRAEPFGAAVLLPVRVVLLLPSRVPLCGGLVGGAAEGVGRPGRPGAAVSE